MVKEKTIKIIKFFITVVLLGILYSCGNKSTNGQKTDSLEVSKTEQVANEQAQQGNTPEKFLNKEDIKSIVLDTLKIDSEDYGRFFSDVKTSENETIMAIGGESYEEREDIFIVICDNFGNIKSKYTCTKEASAEHISGIKIMDTPYNVKENAQLIGVLISRSHQGYSPSLAKEASLFIVEDEKNRPILEDCTTYFGSSIVESTTEILPDSTSKSTNGFYELKLITTEFDIDEESGTKIDSTKVEKVMSMNSSSGKYEYKQTSTQQLPELTDEEKAVVYKYFSEEEIRKNMDNVVKFFTKKYPYFSDLLKEEGFRVSPEELEKKWGKATKKNIENINREVDDETYKVKMSEMVFPEFEINSEYCGKECGWAISHLKTETRGFGFGGVYVGVPECNKEYLLKTFKRYKPEEKEYEGEKTLYIDFHKEFYRQLSIKLDNNGLVKSVSYDAQTYVD